MAMYYSDGFDRYGASADLDLRYIRGAGSVTYGAAAGAFGGGAVTVAGAASTNWWRTKQNSFSRTMDGSSEVHIAFWFKCTDMPAHRTPIGGWITDQTADPTSGTVPDQFYDLQFDQNGAVYVGMTNTNHAGDLSPGSSNAVIVLNNWHHVEFICRYRSSGGYSKVYVDQQLVVNFSGDNVSGSDPAAMLGFLFRAGDGGFGDTTTFIVDDIIMWDATGSDFVHSPLPYTHRIETLSVDGDVSHTFATTTSVASPPTHYTEVDDPAFNDGDTTYNEADSIGQKDMFTLANQAVTPLATLAIAVHTVARKTDTGVVNMHNHLKTGSTEVEGGDHNLTTSYAAYSDFWGKNPETSASWGTTDVNAVTVGAEYQS